MLFQWVNPKIWAVALAASAGYMAAMSPVGAAAQLSAAFVAINLGVCLFWTGAGTLLSKLLTSQRAWVLFRRAMGILLAASCAMVFP